MGQIIAIMQPYFLPYIGYWQLINEADKFVIYDNIQYTKKGWVNRNRFLQNGKDEYFTLPLKKDSDYFHVKERYISDGFNKKKLLNQIKSAYCKAPFFQSTFQLFEEILSDSEKNLFMFLYCSIMKICSYLNIKTEIIVSSLLPVDHALKSEGKVLAICKILGATEYINAIGGQELYNKEIFKQNNIELKFLKTGIINYKQFSNDFVPYLSILDVLMFNSVEEINEMLDKFELI
jgi:hypothetical protein